MKGDGTRGTKSIRPQCRPVTELQTIGLIRPINQAIWQTAFSLQSKQDFSC